MRPRPRLAGLALVVAAISIGATSLGTVAADENTPDPASQLESDETSVTTTVAPIPPTVTTTAATTTTTTTTTATATTTTTTIVPAPAQQNVIAYPSQIAHVLATIRYMESRGNYTLEPNRGNASGAYQFIASTWDNFGGYEHSHLAPPEVQDERAAIDVAKFLAQWNNDVSMVPVLWYFPKAARDLALMDIVPVPSAGNVLTVREYQQRWLGVWAFISGRPVPRTLSWADTISRLGAPPSIQSDGESDSLATIAFPVLGPSRVATPECGLFDQPQENTEGVDAGLCSDNPPGIVFGVKLQPVLAVVDGVVTGVDDRPGTNISVTITDESGRSYTMAGFNDDNPGTNDGAAPAHLRLSALARVGTTVRAGQIIGFMGDTDPIPLDVRADVPTDATIDIPLDAIAPHIRLTINDLDRTSIDAYGPVIDALFRQVCTVGTGPWSSPPNGEGHYPVTIETTDDSRYIDSEWIITSNGQVTASGWAAMIYPGKGCGYTPAEARGPGADGKTDVPDSWSSPIDLPTSIWVDLAVQTDNLDRVPFLLR